MSVTATKWARKVPLKNSILRQVLICIAIEADNFGRVYRFKQRAWLKCFGLTKRQIFYCLSELSRLGVIVFNEDDLIYLRIRMGPETLGGAA